MKNYFNAFARMFNYTDEASLTEFWSFFIINMMMNIIIRIVVRLFDLHVYFHNAYIVIAILALVAIGFRRLKNAGYSGWLFLIPIVNLVLALAPEKKAIV
jgi:uncharacterized membrane protein YhaH (DUF805 family)